MGVAVKVGFVDDLKVDVMANIDFGEVKSVGVVSVEVVSIEVVSVEDFDVKFGILNDVGPDEVPLVCIVSARLGSVDVIL